MGPLHARRVLAPFAEQLVAALAPTPGTTVWALAGDDGVLAAELGRRGAQPVDQPPAAAAATLGTLALAGRPVDSWQQLAAGGRPAVGVHFDARAAHEALVSRALAAVGMAPSAWRTADIGPTGAIIERLRDVIRFDSVIQFLQAMVDGDRGLNLDRAQRDRVLSELTRGLEPFTALDGTIRLPVVALLLRTPAG